MTSSLKEQLPDKYDDIQDTLESAKLILADAVPNANTLFHTQLVLYQMVETFHQELWFCESLIWTKEY